MTHHLQDPMEPSPTTLILDLRDRMARIETKLDGHQDAHIMIDKCFTAITARQDATDAAAALLAERLAETRAELAIGKARLATLATVGSGIVALVTYSADRLWTLLAH